MTYGDVVFRAQVGFGLSWLNHVTAHRTVNSGVLENRLVICGLRPRPVERSAAVFPSVLPKLVQRGIGGVKVLMEVRGNGPVLYLILLMLATLITALVIEGKVSRITPKDGWLLGGPRSTVPLRVKPGHRIDIDAAFKCFAIHAHGFFRSARIWGVAGRVGKAP